METVFNLAWILLAGVLVCLWVRHAPRCGANRRIQVASLTILILFLFPVISVTDDLQAAQNPTETETYVRRGHTAGNQHTLFPAVPALPSVIFPGLLFGYQRLAAPSHLSIPAVANPALAAIQNRPPPAI
ncbi:MAG: hypothetical protein P4K83_04130 [Terracidiphilus sp.]|nr:hypothetical protein [Terracidiphilus sp.]